MMDWCVVHAVYGAGYDRRDDSITTGLSEEYEIVFILLKDVRSRWYGIRLDLTHSSIFSVADKLGGNGCQLLDIREERARIVYVYIYRREHVIHEAMRT
jgi:hypothetical protein